VPLKSKIHAMTSYMFFLSYSRRLPHLSHHHSRKLGTWNLPLDFIPFLSFTFNQSTNIDIVLNPTMTFLRRLFSSSSKASGTFKEIIAKDTASHDVSEDEQAECYRTYSRDEEMSSRHGTTCVLGIF
jgi:hypothetical protein